MWHSRLSKLFPVWSQWGSGVHILTTSNGWIKVWTPSQLAWSLLLTLPDGREFPQLNGEPLSWPLGNMTLNEEKLGYPRLRRQILAMLIWRPDQLENEKRDCLAGAYGGCFSHNARKLLKIIESVENEVEKKNEIS